MFSLVIAPLSFHCPHFNIICSVFPIPMGPGISCYIYTRQKIKYFCWNKCLDLTIQILQSQMFYYLHLSYSSSWLLTFYHCMVGGVKQYLLFLGYLHLQWKEPCTTYSNIGMNCEEKSLLPLSNIKALDFYNGLVLA